MVHRLIVVLALVARIAHAEPPLTAADVKDAPRPDEATGIEQDDRSPARHLLWIPRVILFVPKWTLWVVAAPIRGGLYAFERYGVGPRLRRLLDGGGPVSVYPSAAAESGHGLTYGIGAGASRYARATFLFGGEVRQFYGIKLGTHELLGKRLALGLDAELHRLEESQFFGIGNGSLEPAGAMGVDALADPTAVATRYDQEVFRAELAVDGRPLAHVETRASAALLAREFAMLDARSAFVDATAVYDPATLVGFADGVRYGYGELRLGYDDRITTNPFTSLAQPSSGWKLEAYAGYAHGFARDPSRYVRFALDLQRYIDLYGGDRILLVRAYHEGVTADIDEIPFTELPRLGGSRLMRGYARNRFRDRHVSMLSVEYKFPINRHLGGFAFVDAGGAWRRARDAGVSKLHYAYGGGVQLHTADLFLLRLVVGAGEDGVLVYVSFNPASQLRVTSRNL